MAQKEHDDVNNVYAKNVQGDRVFVLDVKRGKHGYFCLGCGREMQAMHANIQFRKSFFRHDPIAVKGQPKCTYSDETERHKLAKEILQRIKTIKVPTLCKYPPTGNGLANVLQEAKFITAHSVGIERTFYEDDEGNIHCGPNKKVDEKYLLIRPDVTFFDKMGTAILFIELVATHAVSPEKRAKLKRLGVNTVQVRVPKDSPQSIEQSFYTTEKIKWVYNHVEESTDYVPVSNGTESGVSPIDEDQRKLFRESFKCRQAQINNLIRTLTRGLESESYRGLEQRFGAEISRVERNTEEHRGRLDELREERRAGVAERLRSKIEEAETGRREFEERSRGFQRTSESKGEEYRRKAAELSREEEEIGREERLLNSQVEGEISAHGGDGKAFDRRKAEIERDAERVGQLIEREKSEIRAISEKGDGLPERFRNLKEGERRKIEDLEREEAGLPEQFKSDQEQLAREFEDLRAGITEKIAARDSSGSTGLSRGIKNILDGRKQLDDIQEAEYTYKRNRKAWDSFNSGAYQSWT